MASVVALTPRDAEKASLLERGCLSVGWSEAQVLGLLSSPDGVYIGAFENGSLVGCASAYIAADELQINNICVDARFRRRGIAAALLRALYAAAKEKGASRCVLEVATDNSPALALYAGEGFVTVGKRKGYYGGGDAAIMEKTLICPPVRKETEN